VYGGEVGQRGKKLAGKKTAESVPKRHTRSTAKGRRGGLGEVSRGITGGDTLMIPGF